MSMLFAVQWIHIVSAALWFGSVIAIDFVLLPVMMRSPAAQSHAAFPFLASRMARLASIAGQLTFWFGLVRGTAYGPIKSFADLFGTPYGHIFLAALVLTVVAIVHGVVGARRAEQRIWEGDQYRPDAAAYVLRSGIMRLILFGLIVACMVMMRFGL